MACPRCQHPDAYFTSCARYYIQSLSMNVRRIIQKKNMTAGFKGVNIVPFRPTEIGDAITPNYAELPRDRYYMTYEDIPKL